MSQKRYYIRAGARTTADGVVKASCTFSIQAGKALAREGDPVDCPACGKQGVIQCVAPRLSDQSEGRQYALSDDLCVCACTPSPKLLADQFDDFQIVADSLPA